jgi:uncharacterized protein
MSPSRRPAASPSHATPARVIALAVVALLLPALPTAAHAQGAASSPPALGSPLGTPTRPAGTAAAAAAPAASPRPASPRPGSYREIKWEDLVPPNWDPMKEFQGMNFGILSDADPRAVAMLKKMREVWDAAPVNNRMNEIAVRLPGYVVPLEENKAGMTEFLLVPYYGACIHTPPPPANQIIHVAPTSPARNLKSMDTVWVSGILRTLRTDSYMGVSGYRLEAFVVEPYVEPGTRR